MSFAPFIAGSGYGGWAALARTRDRQMTALANSADVRRDEAYFRDKIGSVKTAADLVSDARLLRVSLTAFGLENDVGNRAFIRRILEDGTLKADALAHKLSDKRYLEFSKAFGFDLSIPRNQMSDFADKTLAAFKERRFEAAVGQQSEGIRVALNAQRELSVIAKGSGSVTTKWFRILGAPPLRKFVEGALGLPPSFGAIDLDQQVQAVRDKLDRRLGTDDPAAFADPRHMDKMIRLFLARDGQTPASTSRAQMALQLLSPAGDG